MAREHHCPNDGPQNCNAATSKIHTCGLCGASWEEDLSAPAAAPVVRPVAPTTAAAGAAKPAMPALPASPTPDATPKPSASPLPRPAAPAPATGTAAKPSAQAPSPPPAATKPAVPVPAASPAAAAPVASPPAATAPAPPSPPPPAPTAPPAEPGTPPPASGPAGKPRPLPPPPGEAAVSTTYRDEFVGLTDGLAAKVKAAKVATCPRCQSPDLAVPSQYLEVSGRLALGDSQSYRGHWWYADTGEPFTPPAKAALQAPA